MRTNLHEAFLSDVNNLPTFEIVVTSTAGSILVIDDDRLGANSLSFKYSNGDGSLVDGGASISACSFTVMTFESDTYANFDYSDANVDIKIHINGYEGQYWHGYVIDAKQSYNTITVSCYDVLGRADEYTVSELNINFPTSRSALVSAICTKIGADGFGGETISSAVIPTMDTSVTLRQALSYVAEAEAVSWFSRVYDDYTVYLIAKKIDWDTVYNIEDIFGRGLSQYQTSIDCVDVTSYDKTKSEAVGSFGDRTRVVSQNPCITADTFDVDIAKIKSTYLDESNVGRKFIAGTLTILSDPGLECCDVISVMHNGVVCRYVVGAITFKGTVTMALSMKQPTGDTADKRQSSAETQINSDLKDSNSNLSKAISEGGGGSSSLVSMYGPLWYGTSSSTLLSVSDVTDKDGNTPQFIMLLDGGESSRLYYVKKMVISPIYCLDSTSLGVSTDKTYNVRTKLTRVIAMATCYCSYQPDEELPAIPPQTRIPLELNIRSYMPDSELATSGYLDIERISLTPELGVHSRYDGLLVNWTNPTVLANDSQQQMISTGTFRLNDGVTMRMQYKKIT